MTQPLSAQDLIRIHTPARLERAVDTLQGLLAGITIDQAISASELNFLQLWMQTNADLMSKRPLRDIARVVDAWIANQVCDAEAVDELQWLCRKIKSRYFDDVSRTIQQMHGLLGGIAADGRVTAQELLGLRQWLEDHPHLATFYPFDEVDALVTHTMTDGTVTPEEESLLLRFFAQFAPVLDDPGFSEPLFLSNDGVISGICAVCPQIKIAGSRFCFTGTFLKHSRAELQEMTAAAGGIIEKSVTRRLNYLIIGAEGNPCWAYACYGRKVEHAITLRKQQIAIVLVHELDFLDAVADQLPRQR